MAQPTRLRFEADGAGTYYIDLAQGLSRVRRKLVRQGQNFAVHAGVLQDSNNGSYVRINTAPQAWVVNTALRRAKRMWDKSYRQVVREGGLGKNAYPKYWDWKVYLSDAHRTSSTAQRLIPVDANGNQFSGTGADWGYSRFISEDVAWDQIPAASANRDADMFEAHIVGDHAAQAGNPAYWDSIGIIESWKDTRPEPDADNPDMPSDAQSDPLANLFDESDADDEKMDVLDHFGDAPPYDVDDVPGDGSTMLERMAMAKTSSANPIVHVPGFMATHGLLEVVVTQDSAGLFSLLLDVEPVGGIY
jgi:hypothetical protein